MADAKCVFLGQPAVGKSSIHGRLVHGVFDTQYKPTIGALCETWRFKAHGTLFQVSLWDTAGQEMYRSLTPCYVRGARIAFLVFDLTDRTSFTELERTWWKMLQDIDPHAHVIVLANKSDLPDHAVGEGECDELARRIDAKALFRTSAKTGEGVDEIPEKVAECIEPLPFPEQFQRGETILTEARPAGTNECC
jgi:small GTP-binding protein